MIERTYFCRIHPKSKLSKLFEPEARGWWFDICGGQKIQIRKATDDDLERCGIRNSKPTRYVCEAGDGGSVIPKKAIAYVEVSPQEVPGL